MPNNNIFDMQSWMSDNGYSLVGNDPSTGQIIAKDAQGNQGPLDVDSILKDNGVSNRKDLSGIQFNTMNAPLESSPLGIRDRLQLDKLFSDENSTKQFLKKNFDDFRINEDDGTIVGEKNGVWSKLNPSIWGNGDAWKFTKALFKFGMEGPSYGKDKDGKRVVEDPRFKNLVDVKDEFMKGVRGLDKSTDKSIGEFATELVSGAPQFAKNAAEAIVGSNVANATLWGTRDPGKALAAGGAAAGVTGAGIRGVTTSLGRIMGTYNAPAETQLADSVGDGILSAFGHTVALGVQPQVNAFWNLAKTVGQNASDSVKEMVSRVWAAGAKEDPAVVRKYFTPSFLKESASVMEQAESHAFQDVQRVTIPRKAGVVQEILTQAPKQIQQDYADGMEAIFNSPKAKGLSFTHEDLAGNLGKTLEDNGLGAIVKGKGGYEFRPFNNSAEQAMNGQEPVPSAFMKEVQPYIQQMVDHLNDYKFEGNASGKRAALLLTNFQKGLNFVSRENIDPKLANQISRVESLISSGMKNQTAQMMDEVGLGQEYTAVNAAYSKASNAMKWANYSLPQLNKSETIARQYFNPGFDDTTGNLKILAGSLGDYGNELLDKLDALHAVERSSRMFSGHGKWYGFGGATGAGLALASGHPLVAAGIAAGELQSSPRAQAAQAIAAQKFGSFFKSLDKATMSKVLQDPKLFSTFISPVLNSQSMQEDIKHGLLQNADQALQQGHGFMSDPQDVSRGE